MEEEGCKLGRTTGLGMDKQGRIRRESFVGDKMKDVMKRERGKSCRCKGMRWT